MTLEEFCKAITVLCDSREQRNMHILQGLNEIGVKFKSQKLLFGDYSFTIEGKAFSNFSKVFLVERKANLTELAGNITPPKREVFKREFERACSEGAKIVLLIEDEEGRHKMIHRKMLDENKELTSEQRWKKTWRTDLTANSMIGTLKAWKDRYGFEIVFCDKKQTATELITAFYNHYVNEKENENV